MIPRTFARAAALAAALSTLPAAAQSRPDEASMFGGEPEKPAAPSEKPQGAPDSAPPSSRPDEDSMFGSSSEPPERSPATPRGPTSVNPSAPPAQPPAVEQSGREETRDEQALSGPSVHEAFGSEEHADDPLKIGGQFYLRAVIQGSQGTSFGNTAFSAPTLVDGYFDARPTDRLRGMVVGRLSFDPTLAGQGFSFLGVNPSDGSTGTPGTARPNPSVLLDQAWLRFDIERTVFVTAGKQHVKWGTSRFWNPTDFLSPQRRDPLAVFDARTGASMLKLHVPWEATGWNFYGIAMLDNAGPASTLGRIGGAARAELVLGEAEMGISAVLQRSRKPRLGFDISSALGPLDVYAEAAIKKGSDTPLYRLPEGLTFQELIEQAQGLEIRTLEDLKKLPVESYFPDGLTPQISGGANYTFAYSENDSAIVGVEYFYNSTGYSTPIAYPYLIAQGAFQPFYTGKHYGGLYGVLVGPGSWDKTSFILSTLGNLSDLSFTTRLDVSHRALSYMSVEAFAAVNYGTKGGEFRFALDYPPFEINGRPLVPAPTAQVGLGLRINL
jgi:hypothetical protein